MLQASARALLGVGANAALGGPCWHASRAAARHARRAFVSGPTGSEELAEFRFNVQVLL